MLTLEIKYSDKNVLSECVIQKKFHSTADSKYCSFNMTADGTSLVVQWLRFHAPNAGDPGSIPGQGNRSHMLQLKILHAATKTCHNQINKYVLKRKK